MSIFKNIITILTVGSSTMALSQTGIGTVTPNASSSLHLEANNKGVLFPRTALLSYTDATTVPTPANGLMVYHTASTLNGAGLYINMGNKTSPQWLKFDYYIPQDANLNVNKLIYSGTTSDNTKIMTTQYYEWRIVKATTTTYSVQARLRSLPASTVSIMGSVKLWTSNNSASNTVNTSWTTSDWNTWKNIYTYTNNWDSTMYIHASNDTNKFYKLSGHVELDVYNLLVMEIF